MFVDKLIRLLKAIGLNSIANSIIKKEYAQLANPKSLDESGQLESYKKIVDVGFKLLYDQHKRKQEPNSAKNNDADLLFQMTLLKCLAIRDITTDINYENDIDSNIRMDIKSPFSVWPIVRAQFEAYCNFNNIYIRPNSSNEIEFLYHLWVLSGLTYRQRFPTFIS